MPYDPVGNYIKEYTPEIKLFWKIKRNRSTPSDYDSLTSELLTKKLYIGKSILEAAITFGSIQDLKEVLKRIDIQTEIHGDNLLLYAIKTHNSMTYPLEKQKLLLKAGLDINSRPQIADYIISTKNFELFKLAVSKGMSIKDVDFSGRTTFQFAVEKQAYDIALYIVQRLKVENLFSHNYSGFNVLHFMGGRCYNSNEQLIIEKILEKPGGKALLDKTNAYGDSPLSHAVQNYKWEQAETFLKAGADPNIYREDSCSNLVAAVINDLDDLACLMLDCGAKVTDCEVLDGQNLYELTIDRNLPKTLKKLEPYFKEYTERREKELIEKYGLCNKGYLQVLSGITRRLTTDRVDVRRSADITIASAEAVLKTVGDAPVCILGRDAEPIYWVLKEKFGKENCHYFLLSRMNTSCGKILDKAARKWWRTEIPKGAYVVDTGYAGSIITAIRRSIDCSITGLLISSSGTYKELSVDMELSHNEIVKRMEKIPKIIGRCSSYDIDSGDATCNQDNRDCDERINGMIPSEIVIMRTLLCDELGLDRKWATFTGVTHEERVNGPSEKTLEEMLLPLTPITAGLPSYELGTPLYHCGSPTCPGCGLVPKSPLAKLMVDETGTVSLSKDEILNYLTSIPEEPKAPDLVHGEQSDCSICQPQWTHYKHMKISYLDAKTKREEAASKIAEATEDNINEVLASLFKA